MKLTTKQLVAELRKIADKIEQNDSFEGSIFYTCNAERLEPDEWEVSGAYRLVDINYKNWKNQGF